MRSRIPVGLVLLAALVGSCGGGGSGGVAAFAVVQFLEDGQNEIPRNRVLEFRFSQSVAPVQDLTERLKIQNVVVGQNPNLSLAIGRYIVDGDRVTFVPKLPERTDRSDAGLRPDGDYVVFVKSGPDALQSAAGAQITTPQEFTFHTNEFFEDPLPTEPPRALRFFAVDTTTGLQVDLSRVDPAPEDLAVVENSELITQGLVIDPGAGGGPDFGTRWQFHLELSEPMDPATITTKNITMTEIFDDATKSGPVAPPVSADDGFGTPVSFKVPIQVEVVQALNDENEIDVFIRVTPLLTLVDNARYRIDFSGSILGIDYRQSFLGTNGVTGDGLSIEEPGGLGYQTEFLVRDRPVITTERVLEFDPLVDGVQPELGQTETDEIKFNTALYNPLTTPSQAVGFLSGFGNGTDGALAVSGGQTLTIDTGDTRNPDVGNPFTVTDLDPNDMYNSDSRPGGPLTFDSPEAFEMQLSALTVSSSSTLRIVGVNPILFRVKGLVDVNGLIDVSGTDGGDGGGAVANAGVGGVAGFMGGESRKGGVCTSVQGGCLDWDSLMSACANIQTLYPRSKHGEGPGRGLTGGETYSGRNGADQTNNGISGTGGGGGSHGAQGEMGEDRRNINGIPGTPGPACSNTSVSGFLAARNSGVIGVRSMPGPSYGDRRVIDVTLGGSGGGAGGATHTYFGQSGAIAGGAGGGGGGSLAIYASASIRVAGGTIDASGGDGGKGNVHIWQGGPTSHVSGAGGGGAGGNIVLISGDAVELAGSVLDTTGGAGGQRGNVGTPINCNTCNRGGAGGKGFIFLMDADGVMNGFLPGLPGEYDGDPRGVLTISEFTNDRFGPINAVTELYNAGAANPRYQELSPLGILGTVAPDQRIRVFLSAAKADVDEPVLPDQTTEEPDPPVAVAVVRSAGGAVVVDLVGSATDLNPATDPGGRRPFLRCRCLFEYDDSVQAALGPFASIDRVVTPLMFNG